MTDHYGYKRAETKYTAQITEIKLANTLASEKSREEFLKYKREKETFYAEQALKADTDYANLRGQFNANLLRYATLEANRIPARDANGSKGSTGEVGTAQRSDGPSSRPDFYADSKVVITYTDAQICVDNTARLIKVRDWGKSILLDQLTTSKTLSTSIPTTSIK